MHVLRKIGSGVCLALLPLFLFSFGFLFSLYQVIGSADGPKSALEKSGAYGTFIENSLNSNESRNSSESVLNDIPTQDPEIRRIFREAFPPHFLQQQTEGFLDGVYGWLRGEQSHLQFTIDLRGSKTKLVDGLAAYAQQRASQLPKCDSAQSALRFEAIDIFSASCVPPVPGFDSEAIAGQVRREIANSELFEDTVVTANDIKNNGRTLEQQLEGARDGYSAFRAGVYVAGVVSLLLAAGVVLLPPGWRPGARRAAIVSLAVGGVSALLAWASAFAVSRLSANIARDNPGEMVSTLANALSYLFADLRNWWLGYGLLLAFLGAAALITIYILKKHQKPAGAGQGKDTARPAAAKPQ